MNKREYLNKLREYLAYELPERYVVKNLDYYSDYIDKEVSGGRNLPAVLEDLGDPQLIARSIIDAAKSGADGIPYTDDDEDFTSEIYADGKGPNTSGSWFGSGSSQGGSSNGGGQSGSGSSQKGGSGWDSIFGNGRDSGSGESSNGWDSFFGSGRSNSGFHMYNIGCFGLIMFALIFMCVFSLLGALLGSISPILAPICMVLLVMWLLNRRS